LVGGTAIYVDIAVSIRVTCKDMRGTYEASIVEEDVKTVMFGVEFLGCRSYRRERRQIEVEKLNGSFWDVVFDFVECFFCLALASRAENNAPRIVLG
jgi:hypothetical protein